VADVRGRDLDAVLADVEKRLADVRFPLEYHSEVVGRSAATEASWDRVLGAVAAALVAILLLLQATFGSWRFAAAYLLTLPVALVGGVLAAMLAGGSVGLGSLIGFGAVLALTARNGALLVAHLQERERDDPTTGRASVILRGGEERVTPILMTAFATAALLLPFAVAGGAPGLEIAHAMAVVALGGLVTSTLATLVLLPALYLRLAARPEPERVEPAVAAGPVGVATGNYMHEEA
jgi:Cu/Ag efflux pump CusA